MGGAHIRANELQKTLEPARQQAQGPVQAAAPQVVYRRVQLNGNGLRPADLLTLQRAVGNRAVQRMVARASDEQQDETAEADAATTVQTKLTAGAPDGVRTQGADRVAGQVMTMPDAAAQRPNHTGLPDNLKSGVETVSGMSMDSVKVHYNSSRPAQLNALAYTQGSDIHVAPGQEQHLPHEAWHVVQQAQGRVQPTMQMKDGVPVNDDEGLEQEADVRGARALAPAAQITGAPEEEELLQGKLAPAQSKGPKSDREPRDGAVAQRRPLEPAEEERRAALAEQVTLEAEAFTNTRHKIMEIIDYFQPLPLNVRYLENRVESRMPDFEQLFLELPDLAERARLSVRGLQRLESRLGWYRKSPDGKALLEKTLGQLRDLRAGEREADDALLANERDDLTKITKADERYFRWYLKQGRPALQVYRGDGRNINAQSLDNFAFIDIPAGGTTDISFYGVVQHTHSSADKNGMVSTTTDRAQAHDWAMDGHNHGIVFELMVDNYIDVAKLLAARNFRNRFAAQLEILIPGNVPAAQVHTAVLYSKQGEVKRHNNG